MMMLSEIANALDAKMIGNDIRVQSVGTDSRHIVPAQLFVAIKGEHFDGNQYAVESIKQGAAAALISDETVAVSPAVLVDDARLALGTLASYWRQKFSLPIIAVTGSNGKTTVKEMIASILRAAGGEVLVTQGNLNNDIGMPLTLLRMQDNHSHAVIEMGMNHQGEIRYLTNIATPDVALVNNAGTAHIGELGSREAIAEAKGEIFEGLSDTGIAIINANDRFADYWHSVNQGKRCITFGVDVEADVSTSNSHRASITIQLPSGEVNVRLQALGKHNVSNALAAAAVAVALDVPSNAISAGLSAFAGVNGRLQSLQGKHGGLVIDDTYNANPDSMKAAIDVLKAVQQVEGKTAIFVMGDMAELGNASEAMHAEVGNYAKQCGVNQLFTIGPLSIAASNAFGQGAAHFDTKQALIQQLEKQANKRCCILIKGSRSMKMETLVAELVSDKQMEGMH